VHETTHVRFVQAQRAQSVPVRGIFLCHTREATQLYHSAMCCGRLLRYGRTTVGFIKCSNKLSIVFFSLTPSSAVPTTACCAKDRLWLDLLESKSTRNSASVLNPAPLINTTKTFQYIVFSLGLYDVRLSVRLVMPLGISTSRVPLSLACESSPDHCMQIQASCKP
jgi:hypothetical protein